MKALQKLCVAGFTVCMCLNAATLSAEPSGASLPATRPAGEPIAQLVAGKAAGTFHLVYQGKAQLAVAGQCELVASVRDALRRDIGRMKANDSNDFRFEADVPPGSYYLTISP